jgi:hypothetical protein
MTDTIRHLLTPGPVGVDETTILREVAAVMRDQDVGDVILLREGN